MRISRFARWDDLQIHPVRELLWASNGFSASSVAIEFAGNFPYERASGGRARSSARNQLTWAQIAAGRRLRSATFSIRWACGRCWPTASLAPRARTIPAQTSGTMSGNGQLTCSACRTAARGSRVGGGNPIPSLWRAGVAPRGPVGGVREVDSGDRQGAKSVPVWAGACRTPVASTYRVLGGHGRAPYGGVMFL
jgi:hypothetical protein